MKYLYAIAVLSCVILWSSCRNDFETVPSTGNLEFSRDTVYLDTIFSNIGSSTYNLKVYNRSDDDINIFRNLSGGVTSIQILHGSANPIGGRSAIIKLKWGESAENLINKNAPKFIKFALGENVKQSNWQSIVSDARRYIPILNDCTYRESLWEVKTVLPQSEVDDSRPILFRPNYGLTGFHCVLGGKIDNVYDVIDLIEERALVG